MLGYDDLYAHFSRALHHRVKVVYFEPQQDSVSVRFVIAIADRAVMMLDFKTVQLKHELATRYQLFINGTSMIAPAAEQTLIPLAACFHVGHSDQRLRTHPRKGSRRVPMPRTAPRERRSSVGIRKPGPMSRG
jgi:hypothetical protein